MSDVTGDFAFAVIAVYPRTATANASGDHLAPPTTRRPPRDVEGAIGVPERGDSVDILLTFVIAIS
jgi:hypothetical protein